MTRDALLKIATGISTRHPFVRRAPTFIKRFMRLFFPPGTSEPAKSGAPAEEDEYSTRIAREQEIFTDQVEVNDLPPIFHYWSDKHIRPKLEQFGYSNPDEFFAHFLQRAIEDEREVPAGIASIGPGNCDTEVRVARILVDRGITNFTIECLDINSTMLERGAAMAKEFGVAAQIRTRQLDFNMWNPEPGSFVAVMANQSLHHVLELEALFDAVNQALSPGGRFITSDLIGRNGHMRWPEAMQIIHQYWRELPESYRWNVQLKRHEKLYEYWDCSGEGFEGIRAQDILPLLLEKFSFEFFLPFGNVIEPFIGRSFGPHFNVDVPEDRAMIDRIQERDENEILAGNIKPTNMLAVLRQKNHTVECTHPPGLTPEFCVRRPHFDDASQ